LIWIEKRKSNIKGWNLAPEGPNSQLKLKTMLSM